jgi:hypothetical protein
MVRRALRVAAVLAVVYFCVVALSFLQGLFDRGDLRRAAHVIYEFRPGGPAGKTLVELMAAADGVVPDRMACQTEMASRYEGRVLTTCRGAAGTEPFVWVIDVVGGRVEPQGPRSRLLTQAGAGK